MIDPSLLTKSRKTRITGDTLEETIQHALDKGLIKLGAVIVGSPPINAKPTD